MQYLNEFIFIALLYKSIYNILIDLYLVSKKQKKSSTAFYYTIHYTYFLLSRFLQLFHSLIMRRFFLSSFYNINDIISRE